MMILLWVTGLMGYGDVKTAVSFSKNISENVLFLFIINLICSSYEFGLARGPSNASSEQMMVRFRETNAHLNP